MFSVLWSFTHHWSVGAQGTKRRIRRATGSCIVNLRFVEVNDWFSSRYQDDTFIITSQNGSASFAFKGTGVWLFGAKRINHGNYSVTLDDTSPQVFDGNDANGKEQTAVARPLCLIGPVGKFQTLLFGASSLSHDNHNVVVTNLPINVNKSFVDLDFVCSPN